MHAPSDTCIYMKLGYYMIVEWVDLSTDKIPNSLYKRMWIEFSQYLFKGFSDNLASTFFVIYWPA